jgi:hypothetical protein
MHQHSTARPGCFKKPVKLALQVFMPQWPLLLQVLRAAAWMELDGMPASPACKATAPGQQAAPAGSRCFSCQRRSLLLTKVPTAAVLLLALVVVVVLTAAAAAGGGAALLPDSCGRC